MSWLVYNNLISLVVGSIACLWFIFLYSLRTSWWQEEHRAHLASMSIVVTVFYLLYLGRTLSQPLDAPGSVLTPFNIVRGILFDVLTAVVVWRLALLLRSKKSDQRRTDHEDAVHETP